MDEGLLRSFKRLSRGRQTVALSVPLNPVPASRPRVTKGGVFYTKRYAQWKRQALLYLPDDEEPIFGSGPVAVAVTFNVLRPRTSKRDWPVGDTDNYLKAILDAITKCKSIWDDDDSVLVTLATKHFVKEEPSTDVLITEL